MDVGKYRALFIDESREHLAELSRLLVELETTKARALVIDEVFRHAHSIKGMAASMGYEPISTLAHRLEDVVGAVRGMHEPIAPSTVDVLLRSVDALTHQVACIRESWPLEGFFDLIRELADVAARLPPGAPAAAVGGGVTHVCVRLVSGCSAPALRAYLVHRRLSELGQLASMTPSLKELKAGQMSGLEARFAFVQVVSEGAIVDALSRVSDIEAITFDAQAAPVDVAPAPPDRPVGDAFASAHKAQATVRVRADLLDDIMDSMGEIFIVRERLRMLLGDRLPADAQGAMDGLATRIRQVHDQVIAARMIPVRSLTDRYPRLVRDLCRALGKDIELEVRGRDIEIDRAVLDNLDVPFIHTLRNAVDHGIEEPARRAEHGKPVVGKIVITATRDRDHVLVSFEDDGAGLDPQKLRDVAVQRGAITAAQAAALTDREAYFLICLPGFSTKSEVSDISGRGVGMDVVSARVEAVGGSLDIQSELGHATRFIFRLPLTLAIIPVLLVQAGNRVFALPAANVVAVRETAHDTLKQQSGSLYLQHAGKFLPLAPLAQLLALGAEPADDPSAMPPQAIIIEAASGDVALGVQRVVGYHEVVVKPLGEPLDSLEVFSGATILGDGQPILILDLSKFLRMRGAAA